MSDDRLTLTLPDQSDVRLEAVKIVLDDWLDSLYRLIRAHDLSPLRPDIDPDLVRRRDMLLELAQVLDGNVFLPQLMLSSDAEQGLRVIAEHGRMD